MRKPLLLTVIVFAVFFLTACTRGDFNITNIIAVPFEENGSCGLCVWASLDLDKKENLKMQVHSPDGRLTWSCPVQETDYAGEKWYGSSDIFLPDTAIMQYGTWTVDFLSKDGRTRTESFDVVRN